MNSSTDSGTFVQLVIASAHFIRDVHGHVAGPIPASLKATSPSSRSGAFPWGTGNRVTDCVTDVADRRTDIARAQTPCGAATEQHYT